MLEYLGGGENLERSTTESNIGFDILVDGTHEPQSPRNHRANPLESRRTANP
jgi:hypothetical protein